MNLIIKKTSDIRDNDLLNCLKLWNDEMGYVYPISSNSFYSCTLSEVILPENGNIFLNNNICDGLWHYSYIEQFSYYLANTINNEDDNN